MLRFAMRLTLRLFIPCVLLIVFVRAQSYDTTYFAALRASITQPPDCDDTPCLLGIYPGETVSEDAYNIVASHRWIDEIIDFRGVGSLASDTGSGTQFVRWHWNGEQPEIYQGRARFIGNFDESKVEFIEVDTGITLGEWIHTFGRPSKLTTLRRTGELRLDYPGGVQVSTSLTCPHIWQTPVTLVIYQSLWSDQRDGDVVPPYATACGPAPTGR